MTSERMIALPAFAVGVLEDLRRCKECFDDFESGGVDIGRERLDLLTQLGLLARVQRSPALWELTQAGEEALAGTVGTASVNERAAFNAWRVDGLGEVTCSPEGAAWLAWQGRAARDRSLSLSPATRDVLQALSPERDAELVKSLDALGRIVELSRALRQGGPAPEDLQDLSEALEEAVAIAHDAVAGLPDPDAAIRSITHERQRQIEAEGWTPERDDQYQQGELAKAAAGYVLHAHADQSWKNHHLPNFWPFAPQWFKPADPRRMLVKAGALVVAEIQRIDRAEARAQEAGHE